MGTVKRRNQVAEKPKGKPRRLRDNEGKLARFAREDKQMYPGTIYKQGPCRPQSCPGDENEVACVPTKNNTEHYCVCTSTGLPPPHDLKCPRSSGTIYKQGPCEPKSCPGGAEEEEVACLPSKNNTEHYCVCTSTGQPPSPDFKCPRSTFPVTPIPIHNIIPPTTSNTSAENRSASPTVHYGRVTQPQGSTKPRVADSPTLVSSNGLLLAVGVVGAVVVLIIVILFLVRRRIGRVDGKAQPVGQPTIDNPTLLDSNDQ